MTVNLTDQDIPTLRRLAEFFADREGSLGSGVRAILAGIVCRLFGDFCARAVLAIERNGKVAPHDQFDSVGRLKPKSGTP